MCPSLLRGHCRHVRGEGFLYTNRESISLGLVVGIDAIKKTEVHTLMDAFTSRREIAPLIKGGTLAEYGAHVIPEGGYAGISRLSTPGMLVDRGCGRVCS